jgi:hypothetical protein
VILRADKGFFDHKLIEWVEQQGAGYLIVARLTPPIQCRLSGLRYRRFGWGSRDRYVSLPAPRLDTSGTLRGHLTPTAGRSSTESSAL